MTDKDLERLIKALKEKAAQPDVDARRLHDDICAILRRLDADGTPVPADLCALDGELVEEIEEQLHDNLPV